MTGDWGPVLAGLVPREDRRRRPRVVDASGSPQVAVPLRVWRVMEAELQTARSRAVVLRIRLSTPLDADTTELTREQLDAELGRIDEGLRLALSLIREGHLPSAG